MNNKIFYAGVGSRKTPDNILALFKEISKRLEKNGFVLRSGGADGADKAFETGVIDPNNKEIFYANHSTNDSENIAKDIHPAWDRCSSFAKKLHGRNVFQIMGHDLKTHSSFVLCWTKGGKPIGGTATAINLAIKLNIPVFNLGDPDHLKLFFNFLKDKYQIKL